MGFMSPLQCRCQMLEPAPCCTRFHPLYHVVIQESFIHSFSADQLTISFCSGPLPLALCCIVCSVEIKTPSRCAASRQQVELVLSDWADEARVLLLYLLSAPPRMSVVSYLLSAPPRCRPHDSHGHLGVGGGGGAVKLGSWQVHQSSQVDVVLLTFT